MSLSGPQERAAALVATSDLRDQDICDQVGVRSTRTLRTWKHLPEFVARVEEHQAAVRASVRARGIAVVEHRIAALQDRWDRMQQVIAARASDPTMTGPGHETGLLVRTFKIVGRGAGAHTIEEYEVDTGLLAELRAHEEQAAKELGQWVDRKSVDSTQQIQVTEVEIMLGPEGGAS